MTNRGIQRDPEIAAMAALAESLDGLDEQVRARVLTWARSRYMTAAVASASPATASTPRGGGSTPLESFQSLGELMAACSVDTDDGRVLVAAAYISPRVEGGALAAAQVNAELKHLGHPMDNITRVFDALIAQRPALVVQLRKSGTTRQARKLYKVTEAGMQRVQRMLGGED